MPKLIKNGQIVDDPRAVLKLAADESAETIVLPATAQLLPLAVWLARRAEILASGVAHGVWLDAGEGPEAIAADLEHLAVIGVNFPKFTDGRGYSTARLLRERYGFRGEIRAIGDVLQDQLYFMKRCGFDAYALREDKDFAAAIQSLDDFSESYQAAADQALPLFRRRAVTP
jgi:uncharacterized protein (DUF934 family)